MENKKVEMRARLREAMNLRNMRAVDICEKTNIPKSAISYYLSGKSEPKSDRIFLLSKALNVSEPWLMGYNVSMERTEEQKKNDAKIDIVTRIYDDPVFLEAVMLLDKLNPEQLNNITSLAELLCKEPINKVKQF